MSTRTETLIAQKLKEVEELRANGLTQDIIDVLQDKRHTKEQLYNVCKAFCRAEETRMRQVNLAKARSERKPKQKQESPITA